MRDVHGARSRLAYLDADATTAGAGRLCAREYLQFVLGARNVKSTRTDNLHALARAGVAADAAVDALSKGLRQRLLLGVAIETQAPLLLLDDPFCAMDASARSTFIDWLRESAERGTAVLAALDDAGDARALCDRTMRLKSGRLVEARDLVGVY